MTQFDTYQLLTTLPEIALTLVAMALLVLGAFKDSKFASSQIRFAIGAMLFVLPVVVFATPESSEGVLSGMFISNHFTTFVKALVLTGSIFVLILSLGFYREHKHYKTCEFPVLILLAVVGMMLMISANTLLALYMGLELQSLALYVLAAMHRDSIKSSEAGLKYFVLGSVASGILLYGCSLIYGFSGTTNFNALAELYTSSDKLPIGTLIGLMLVITGLCFKVSAVPFHMWTPDVYEGAPTPVTAFFAVAPKIAAVAVFVRFLEQPFGNLVDQWQQVVMLVSALSMVIGALGALRQTNIKRLIAYSSIGHVGYVLMGLASAGSNGVEAVLIYLAIYMTMSLGVFACIMMVKHREGLSEDISSLSGLGKTQPLMAMAMAILLLSMAGIPPFAGFFGKFFIFYATVKEGMIGLAVIGGLASVIAAFYYLRIIKIMYFDEASVPLDRQLQPEMKFVAAVSSIFNLLFFISFLPLILIAQQAANSLF